MPTAPYRWSAPSLRLSAWRRPLPPAAAPAAWAGERRALLLSGVLRKVMFMSLRQCCTTLAPPQIPHHRPTAALPPLPPLPSPFS